MDTWSLSHRCFASPPATNSSSSSFGNNAQSTIATRPKRCCSWTTLPLYVHSSPLPPLLQSITTSCRDPSTHPLTFFTCTVDCFAGGERLVPANFRSWRRTVRSRPPPHSSTFLTTASVPGVVLSSSSFLSVGPVLNFVAGRARYILNLIRNSYSQWVVLEDQRRRIFDLSRNGTSS